MKIIYFIFSLIFSPFLNQSVLAESSSTYECDARLTEVVQSSLSGKEIGILQLSGVLSSLKAQFQAILAQHPEYAGLKTAIDSMNPQDLFKIKDAVKNIMYWLDWYGLSGSYNALKQELALRNLGYKQELAPRNLGYKQELADRNLG